ncbi:PilZ domain-containing protein, partial [Myxococcota bacterium]
MAEEIQILPAIILEFADRRAFLDAYGGQHGTATVFVPGHVSLDLGTQVQLEIVFANEGHTFRTRGVMRWRRAQKSRNLTPGVGVEFLETEHKTRDLLLEFANGGETRFINRRDRRLPIRLRVQFTTESTSSTALTDDLSEGGMFIQTDEIPEIGTTVRIKLKPPGHMFAIQVRGEVAW